VIFFFPATQNVLIDKSFACKVADFGLSREMHDSGLATASTGTPHWVAPEVLAGQRYTEKVDVYSYAVVLWEMVTMARPFAGMNPFNLISLFLRDPTHRLEIPADVPAPWRELIEKCWAVDPTARPSFRQIVQFIVDNVPIVEEENQF
jgi:serine/threonine protein kinase